MGKQIAKYDKKEKQKLKFKVTADLIQTMKVLYEKSNVYEREYLETIIGAAIFYLPKLPDLWSGKISVSALKSFLPGNPEFSKVVKDHEYPRKISGSELLQMSWNGTTRTNGGLKLKKLYVKKYGRYNYVTARENALLRNFQKKKRFSKPSIAYNRAGIRLIKIDRDSIKEIKKKNKKLIKKYLGSQD